MSRMNRIGLTPPAGVDRGRAIEKGNDDCQVQAVVLLANARVGLQRNGPPRVVTDDGTTGNLKMPGPNFAQAHVNWIMMSTFLRRHGLGSFSR